jgi:predicted Rossmann-fold nucleotide-binding protein
MSVIPKAFDERGGQVVGIDALMFVEKYGAARFGQQYVEETFDSRQKRLIETADMFLTLPGGVGTVYEVLEVLAYNDLKLWKRDPERVRKIVVFNHCGAYDGLKRHIQDAVEAGYVVASSAEAVVWCDTVEDVVGWLVTVGNS